MEDIIDYTSNVTEFPTRNIPKIWHPQTQAELREIIVSANEDGRAVYPISTGHNWGLGSKLPVKDAEIIDLRSLDKIIEVNEEMCYARIEPGVTQKQLSDFLSQRFPDLMLNVTGSDARSSIIGNILERGSGKNGHRARDLRELSVLLASGDVISTGFKDVSQGKAKPFYRYGLGPDLTHLFTQSGYGVVTEGVVDLMEKQPFDLYLTRISADHLGLFMEAFSKLVRKGVIGHSLELDSTNDPKIFELFEDEEVVSEGWVGWFVIYGDEEIRQAKGRATMNSLSSLCKQVLVYDSENENTEAAAPVSVRLNRYDGIPDDHSLISTARSFNVELDEGNPDIDLYREMPGFRCVLPVIPFSKSGAEVIDFIIDFSNGKSFEPAISIICLDDFSMEVFCRVYFSRNDRSRIEEAADWADGLLEALKEIHIFPYRLDIETMEPYLSTIENDPLELKKEIKKLVDPKQIISPGRYII